MRRLMVLSVALALCAPLVAASAQVPEAPLPELRFATGGEPGTCIRVDRETGEESDPYGQRCSRLSFTVGPIVVQPGANSTYPYVTAIEKPWYDGFMVRIEPNMVRVDGSEPPADEIHLHHATWLSSPSYGNGPFFAAGEEKTVAEFPVPYGMPVQRSDVWYMVHMVHNAGSQPEVVWITYDIDYVAADDADDLGIKTIRPFWLDVWKNGRRSNYPVYNTHRGYGDPITDEVTLDINTDPDTGEVATTTECTWPKQECGAFDSWGGEDVGQGTPGNGRGTDIYVPPDLAGTLIGIGGHLHPGGLRVEVDAVRCLDAQGDQVEPVRPGNTITSWAGLRCPDGSTEEDKRIFTSDATYFDNEPLSWNFRMTVSGVPFWKVNMYEGTMLRINSVYETDRASWYEGMGIAVAYVHPYSDAEEFYGLDPFDPGTEIVDDIPAAECHPTLAANPDRLCTRGLITRGETPGGDRKGGANARPWESADGPVTQDISIAGFLYLPGDLGSVSLTGVPQVRRDEPVTFWNLDAATNVYHTVTACAYPCNGQTGIDYPIADFGWGRGDLAPGGDGPVTYDSAELGYSPDFGPARSQIPPGSGEDPGEWAYNGIAYSFTPADLNLEAGEVYTYYCRVHPFMRGSFKVVE